jgi:hypothetical protein
MGVWSAEGHVLADFSKRTLTMVQPSERLRLVQEGSLALDGAAIAALRADPFGSMFHRLEQECSPGGPDQLTRELQDFVGGIRTGNPVRVTGEQGLEALSVACAIRDAIQRHAWEGEVAGPTGPNALPAPQGMLFPVAETRAA